MGEVESIIGGIRSSYNDLTKSEKLIANYIMTNPERLALENASEIAVNAGVSAMTVSRFARKLGFSSISDIRKAWRGSILGPDQPPARSLRERYETFASRPNTHIERENSLKAEYAALRGAYEATFTAQWQEAVALLAGRQRVYVHGLQVTRGLATEFASRLQFVRPGVYLADGQNGTLAELVCDEPGEICAVLIDFHRYARMTRLLAQRAASLGIPIVIVTDEYSQSARAHTEHVFVVRTNTGLFWHSTAAMSALLNLMVSDIVTHLGDSARSHIERVLAAQEHFDQFLDASR